MAQVLMAMLIAQELNQDSKPIYGCHVIGEFWYFMVMHGKEYAISNGIDASSQAGLQKNVLILRKFKEILFGQLVV